MGHVIVLDTAKDFTEATAGPVPWKPSCRGGRLHQHDSAGRNSSNPSFIKACASGVRSEISPVASVTWYIFP